MSPPNTRDGGRPGSRTPANNAITTNASPATSRPAVPAQTSQDGRVVRGHTADVLHREFHSAVRVGSPAVKKLLNKAVPSAFRETDHVSGLTIVYRSRVAAMLEAFHAHGVAIREIGGGR